MICRLAVLLRANGSVLAGFPLCEVPTLMMAWYCNWPLPSYITVATTAKCKNPEHMQGSEALRFTSRLKQAVLAVHSLSPYRGEHKAPSVVE